MNYEVLEYNVKSLIHRTAIQGQPLDVLSYEKKVSKTSLLVSKIEYALRSLGNHQ